MSGIVLVAGLALAGSASEAMGRLCVVRAPKDGYDSASAGVKVDGEELGRVRRRQGVCAEAAPGPYMVGADAVARAWMGQTTRPSIATWGPGGSWGPAVTLGPKVDVMERVAVHLVLRVEVRPGATTWVAFGYDSASRDPALFELDDAEGQALASRLQLASAATRLEPRAYNRSAEETSAPVDPSFFKE